MCIAIVNLLEICIVFILTYQLGLLYYSKPQL